MQVLRPGTARNLLRDQWASPLPRVSRRVAASTQWRLGLRPVRSGDGFWLAGRAGGSRHLLRRHRNDAHQFRIDFRAGRPDGRQGGEKRERWPRRLVLSGAGDGVDLLRDCADLRSTANRRHARARVEEKAAIEEGLDAQAALPADGDQPAKVDEPDEAVAGPDDAARPPHLAFAEGLPVVVQFVLALGMLVGLAFALPIWGNLHNPMGLLIIGIGLYEAWVINRRVPMTINGPFRIAGAGGGSAAHVEPSG